MLDHFAKYAVCGLLVAAACGSPPAPTAPHAAASASSTPAAPAETPAARLATLLGKLDEGAPVLDALTAASKGELEALLAKLDAPQLAALKTDAALAAARPLLHLVAGGEEPAALYVLATTPAAADDLVLARRGAGSSALSDLVPATRELAERAARRWLRAQRASVRDAENLTPELCTAIAHAADTLSRRELVRAAREVAAQLDPKAQRLLEAADAAAEELDVAGAERSLSKARSAAADASAASRTEARIAAAKLVIAARASTAEEALALGRAQLMLGRGGDIARSLAPQRSAAEKHLGLAAVLTLGSTDGGVCPGLSPAVANAPLCAVAFRQSSAATDGTALLQRAWDSASGRDDTAVEAYLGVVHVTPWTYETLAPTATDPKQAVARFRERLGALQSAAHAAAKGSPYFEPMALFVDTLGAGLEGSLGRKRGDRVRIPEATAADLRARALALAERKSESFVEAAVLGVASLTAQDHDVAELLALLPDEIAPHLRVARASLRFWSAVAHQRADVAEKGKSELIDQLPSGADHQAERVTLLLLMAEVDAALGGADARRLEVLARVGGQLTDVGVPVGLRLRAAIDVSGALSRTTHDAEAIALLDGVVASLPPAVVPGVETDLRIIAISQLLVLRAIASQGAERADYAQKFAALVQGAADDQLPASIRLWRELWKRELAFLQRPASARNRFLDAAHIDEAVGPESGLITRGGTLPAGTLKLSFSFGSTGLTPLVELEPRLLAVRFPPAVAR